MPGGTTLSDLLHVLTRAVDGDATARVAEAGTEAGSDSEAGAGQGAAPEQTPTATTTAPPDKSQLAEAGQLLNELLDLHERDLKRLGQTRDELDDLRTQLEIQRASWRELSTPLIEVWPRVLCLPLIGAIDTLRSKELMERLLSAVSERQARLVIVDITTIQRINPVTAQHLLAIARAVRLLGGEFAISGISPHVAATMISQGLDFSAMKSTRTLYDALAGYINQAAAKEPQSSPPLVRDGKGAPARR